VKFAEKAKLYASVLPDAGAVYAFQMRAKKITAQAVAKLTTAVLLRE
jgi:hypothetical protein